MENYEPNVSSVDRGPFPPGAPEDSPESRLSEAEIAMSELRAHRVAVRSQGRVLYDLGQSLVKCTHLGLYEVPSVRKKKDAAPLRWIT